MLHVLLRNYLVEVLSLAGVYEYQADHVSFLMVDPEGLLQELHLATCVVSIDFVRKREGLEDVCLLESTVEFKDNIVPFESVTIVLIYSLDEELELALHAPTDRVTEYELFSLAP